MYTEKMREASLKRRHRIKSKKVLTAFPKAMVNALDEMAHNSFRNRTEVIKEAVREYLFNHRSVDTINTIE